MNKLEKLTQEIIACRKCPRLVEWREEVARVKRKAYRDSEYCIFFWHDEFPDDWVMSHNIPYETPLADIFFSSVKPSRLTGYLGFYWYDTEVSQQVFLDKKPTYVLWGRIKHSDGSVCRHEEGKAAVFVKIKGRDEILNEKAPVFGRATEVVNDYGYYNIDLGGFKGIEKGDIYTLKVYCPVRNEIVSITDTVGEVGDKYVRKDINLMPIESEEIRVIADKDIWGSGKEVRLFWKSKKYNRFNIYRRDCSAGEGTYKLISKDCEKEFYTDKNIPTGKIYGYVVVPVNDNGEEVFPSQEVNNVFGSDFITDVKYPDQLNNRIKGNAKVVAMEFELELSPGEMQDFRLVRGVERIDVGVDESMLKEAKYLAGIEFSDYIYRNETLFSKLYDPTNLDQEKRMLYWSSFNLMRQVMLPPEGKCSFNYYVFSREPTWGWGHGGQVFHESLTMMAYAVMDPVSAMNSQRVYSERQYESGYINYRTGSFLDEIIEHKVVSENGQEIILKIPGRLHWGDIVLKRGITSSMDIWDWRKQIEDGDIDNSRHDGSVVMYDQELKEVARWNFERAWPVKVTGPQPKADSNAIGIEELTLTHEYITRVK